MKNGMTLSCRFLFHSTLRRLFQNALYTKASPVGPLSEAAASGPVSDSISIQHVLSSGGLLHAG